MFELVKLFVVIFLLSWAGVSLAFYIAIKLNLLPGVKVSDLNPKWTFCSKLYSLNWPYIIIVPGGATLIILLPEIYKWLHLAYFK
jgi:hypothetical protein